VWVGHTENEVLLTELAIFVLDPTGNRAGLRTASRWEKLLQAVADLAPAEPFRQKNGSIIAFAGEIAELLQLTQRLTDIASITTSFAAALAFSFKNLLFLLGHTLVDDVDELLEVHLVILADLSGNVLARIRIDDRRWSQRCGQESVSPCLGTHIL
jgi:hypothetical protein